MIPAFCRVNHEPEQDKFGDCLRAVVASILEIEPPEKVPHFFHDNCNGETGHRRLRDYLETQGLVPFVAYYPGSESLEDILNIQAVQNPDVHFGLFCSAGGGDHIVVCCNGKVVHNPSWVQSKVSGPNSNGFWGIMVLVKC